MKKNRPQLLVSNGVHSGGGMTAAAAPPKAPFPYPGGKSRVADLAWDRLGDVDNYVEPFMGTAAVLLRRPADHFRDGYRVETANDLNHYLVNFWRAVRADPDEVAGYADWPVAEADLHARHRWLVRSAEAVTFRRRVTEGPDYYDAKVAGWWVWGQCCWIGAGWCSDNPAVATPECDGRNSLKQSGEGGVHRRPTPGAVKIPELASGLGRGDAAAQADGADSGKRPCIEATSKRLGSGVIGKARLSQQVPELAVARELNGGGAALATQVSLLSGPGGGVNATPEAGTCVARRAWLVDWMRRLADRLRLVRTCYGHWSRVCDSPSTMTRLGTTGVFLDPPYPVTRADTGARSRSAALYATDKGADLDALRDEVLAWCLRWGRVRQVRVALCCYEGDGYEPLAAEGWAVEHWESAGGYGNQARGGRGKAANARRERIYFSPYCLTGRQPDLFAGVGE